MKTYQITQAARVLAIIIDAYKNGRVLTVRQMAKMLGVKSSYGIQLHLERLKRDGMITSQVGKMRTTLPKCRWLSAEEILP